MLAMLFFALVLGSSVHSSFSAISMWHSRLSHPSLRIFLKFLSILHFSYPEEHLCFFSCTSCNINKSHKIPFSKSSITSSSPLDIIFSMFGPHPFYLLMVLTTMLHYTKYIWFYPLRRKSDVHSTFVAFKQLVENYFTTTIITLYIDNEGEFLVVRSFLVTRPSHLLVAFSITIYLINKMPKDGLSLPWFIF